MKLQPDIKFHRLLLLNGQSLFESSFFEEIQAYESAEDVIDQSTIQTPKIHFNSLSCSPVLSLGPNNATHIWKRRAQGFHYNVTSNN